MSSTCLIYFWIITSGSVQCFLIRRKNSVFTVVLGLHFLTDIEFPFTVPEREWQKNEGKAWEWPKSTLSFVRSFFVFFFFASDWKFPVFLLRVNNIPLNEKKNASWVWLWWTLRGFASATLFIYWRIHKEGKGNRAIDFKSPLHDENQVHNDSSVLLVISSW